MQTKEEIETILAETAPMLTKEGIRNLALKKETPDRWQLSFTVSTQAGPSHFDGQWSLDRNRVWTAQAVFESVMDCAQRERS